MSERLSISSSALFDVLRQFIDLPRHVTSMKIELSVDSIALIECTYTPGVDRDAAPVVKRFELLEIDPDKKAGR